MLLVEALHQYVAYGFWANTRFTERLAQETDAVLDRPWPSSYPSLRATLLHIRDAEQVWFCRLNGVPSQWPAEPDGSLETVLRHAQRFAEHVLGLDEAALLRVMEYADLKGRIHHEPAWQMIMHCVNHSTQHRGQLITGMRILGLGDIPPNDLVVFQRFSHPPKQ